MAGRKRPRRLPGAATLPDVVYYTADVDSDGDEYMSGEDDEWDERLGGIPRKSRPVSY